MQPQWNFESVAPYRRVRSRHGQRKFVCARVDVDQNASRDI